VAFYVPLGPRGLLFRIGTGLIAILGSWVYWRASRSRTLLVIPLTLPFDLPDVELVPFSD
jgi:hypothetical protein